MITVERLDRGELAAAQGRRLAHLLSTIYGRNAFYTRKLDEAGIDVWTLRFPEDLAKLPLTTKADVTTESKLVLFQRQG